MVPSLAGMTVEEARSALAASGFLLGEVRERFDETEPGLVVAQSINEGTKALIGESVDVIISQIMPQSYFAETSITVEVDSDDAEILCILMDQEGGMREVYRERSEAGVQTISLSLDSYVQGEQMLCVYVWDELVAEQKIMFE